MNLVHACGAKVVKTSNDVHFYVPWKIQQNKLKYLCFLKNQIWFLANITFPHTFLHTLLISTGSICSVKKNFEGFEKLIFISPGLQSISV